MNLLPVAALGLIGLLQMSLYADNESNKKPSLILPWQKLPHFTLNVNLNAKPDIVKRLGWNIIKIEPELRGEIKALNLPLVPEMSDEEFTKKSDGYIKANGVIGVAEVDFTIVEQDGAVFAHAQLIFQELVTSNRKNHPGLFLATTFRTPIVPFPSNHLPTEEEAKIMAKILVSLLEERMSTK